MGFRGAGEGASQPEFSHKPGDGEWSVRGQLLYRVIDRPSEIFGGPDIQEHLAKCVDVIPPIELPRSARGREIERLPNVRAHSMDLDSTLG